MNSYLHITRLPGPGPSCASDLNLGAGGLFNTFGLKWMAEILQAPLRATRPYNPDAPPLRPLCGAARLSGPVKTGDLFFIR